MDPLLLKYIGGAALIGVVAVMTWFDKCDKALFVAVVTGAAGALGWQIAGG